MPKLWAASLGHTFRARRHAASGRRLLDSPRATSSCTLTLTPCASNPVRCTRLVLTARQLARTAAAAGSCPQLLRLRPSPMTELLSSFPQPFPQLRLSLLLSRRPVAPQPPLRGSPAACSSSHSALGDWLRILGLELRRNLVNRGVELSEGAQKGQGGQLLAAESSDM